MVCQGIMIFKLMQAICEEISIILSQMNSTVASIYKMKVLFPFVNDTVRRFFASFTIRSFTKFKNMYEDCCKHFSTKLKQTEKDFLENVPVAVQLQSWHQKTIK